MSQYIISPEERALRSAWINNHEGLKRELGGQDANFPERERMKAPEEEPQEGPRSPFRHAGSLYPTEALEMLVASREEPDVPIDGQMERMLGSWIANSIVDYPIYIQDLFRAIHKLKCLPGVYLRLNLACLAIPPMRRQGEAGDDGPEVFTGWRRRRMRRLLGEHKLYCPHIQQVYDRLREIHYTYNLEQALLGWMGYLIVKRVALKAKEAPEVKLPLLGFSG
jgi:hypothetical protein